MICKPIQKVHLSSELEAEVAVGKLASFLMIVAVTLYAVWPWIRRLRSLTGAPSRNMDMTLLDARAMPQLDAAE